eukprot:COSAG06_NODE_18222_length_897_cov_9.904762_1_plen_63_part_01
MAAVCVGQPASQPVGQLRTASTISCALGIAAPPPPPLRRTAALSARPADSIGDNVLCGCRVGE